MVLGYPTDALVLGVPPALLSWGIWWYSDVLEELWVAVGTYRYSSITCVYLFGDLKYPAFGLNDLVGLETVWVGR